MQIWEQAPIRVGLDLDRDLFTCWGSRPGDPLNIIPDPINPEVINPTTKGSWVVELERTDFGIKVIAATLSSYVYDGLAYGSDAEIIAVSRSTKYTLQFAFKGMSGFDLALYITDENSDFIKYVGYTGSDEWQTAVVTFTTTATTDFLKISLEKDNNAATGELRMTGLMLTPGTTAYPFNTGTEISLWQDVTDYVRTAEWQLGMGGPDERVCKDGQATVIVNNDDRSFSPLWVDGPLFGYLDPGIVLTIELQDTDGSWLRKWTGIVEEINPSPTNRQLDTEIIALQGLAYITERETPAVELYDSPTAEDIINILCRGWVPPDFAVWQLDVSQLDVKTVLWGPEGNIDADTGKTYTVFGEEWQTDDEERKSRRYGNVRTLLQQLMEAELGLFWIDEYGVIHFKELTQQATLFSDDAQEIDIDNDAASAEYEYGNKAEVVNSVTVKYYTRRAITGTMAYSADQFTVPAGQTVKKNYRLEVGGQKFSTEEAQVSLTVSSGSATAGLTLTSSSACDVVITNSGGVDAVIDAVEITGSGYVADPPGEVVEYSLPSISRYRQKDLEIDNRFVETETDAETLAGRILALKAMPRGRIVSVSIPGNRDENWYSRQINTSLMEGVYISEYQTGAENWPGVILGVEHSWSPTLLQTRFVIGEGLGNIFWVLDVSMLDVNTVLL